MADNITSLEIERFKKAASAGDCELSSALLAALDDIEKAGDDAKGVIVSIAYEDGSTSYACAGKAVSLKFEAIGLLESIKLKIWGTAC